LSTQNGSSGILVVGCDLLLFRSAVLLLSETVLEIESNQQYCYVGSVHDQPLNATELFP
jgi:hypothetical protein